MTTTVGHTFHDGCPVRDKLPAARKELQYIPPIQHFNQSTNGSILGPCRWPQEGGSKRLKDTQACSARPCLAWLHGRALDWHGIQYAEPGGRASLVLTIVCQCRVISTALGNISGSV